MLNISYRIQLSILTVILLVCYTSKANIGHHGYPFIKNYSNDDFKAGAHNWTIVQGRDGVMYFGNNYGVLEFNGAEWSLIAQPSNKTVIRSLYIDIEGVIYVGAQNEFGYINTSTNGQKYYISLLDKVPEKYRHFTDVWEIFETTLGITFISSEAIYNYSNDSITVIEHEEKFVSYSKVSDSILIQDELNNIFVVKDNHIEEVISNSQINYKYIKKIFTSKNGEALTEGNEELFFFSHPDGFLEFQKNILVPINKELNDYFIQNEAYCFKNLRGGYIAIGTIRNGIIIIDENKNPVQAINKEKGLQSNTILAIGTDNSGNLWVATDSGLDYVEIASPFYQINEYQNLLGAVYSIFEGDEKIYVGTNGGLFHSSWESNENSMNSELDFKLHPFIWGPVWDIFNIDDYIYVCHHQGLFKLNKSKTTRLNPSDYSGAWTIKSLDKGGDMFVQGGYNGLNIYKNGKNGLEFINHVKGFEETSRVIEIDNTGNIWMAHGYKGIFKLELNEDLDSVINIDFYNENKGFPSSLFINLFKIKNEIIFGTEFGAYYYNSELDTMLVHSFYKEVLGTERHIRLLKEVDTDILYIVGNDMTDEVGIIEIYEDGKFDIINTPFQKLKGRFTPGFDNVSISKTADLLFGTKDGMVYYNSKSERNYNKPYNTNITDVICLANDSILYGDFDGDDTTNIRFDSQIISLPFNLNSIEFRYAAAFFESTEEIEYSFFLEGFDNKWSSWNSQTHKQYTNLKNGRYLFHVRAKNVYGLESEEDIVVFEIQSPWLKTPTAYISYAIAVLIIFLLLIWLFKILLEKENKRIISKQFQ